MPHFYIEYTNNIKAEGDIPSLLKKVNHTLLSHSNIIPIGGIRSRAIELTDYLVADDAEDDAFVHAILKVGKGRSKEEKQALCDDLFAVMQEHFAALYARRYLALSMELYEFQIPTYKQNNIHTRFKK